MPAATRVFVSHSSADKARFVMEFASKLREQEIDAWVDEWELLAGDSLVQGILERGLGPSDACVIVISSESLSRPWVRKELDVALERSVSEGYRIIPVLLDGLGRESVPTGLRDILWVTHRDDIRETVGRVVRDLHGYTSKPSLGKSPSYLAGHASLGLDDPADEVVLEALIEVFDENPNWEGSIILRTLDIGQGLNQSADLPLDEFEASLHALQRSGLIDGQPFLGGPPGNWMVTDISPRAWSMYRERQGVDVPAIARRILTRVVNAAAPSDLNVTEFEGLDRWTILAALRILQDEELLQYWRTNQGIAIHKVGPGARRWLNRG